MWHEARKQEKKIRCMLVDYQRRAQRRKDYYDKIKADPTQFLQLHGRPCKIHLDPAVCIAANSSATMMPWQGNQAILIDRFDVRAHLDYIPEISSSNEDDDDVSYEERQINYERYRILVQNDFFNIPEGKFLHQIALEEKFGPVLKNTDESNTGKKKAGATIGYSYDDDQKGNSSNNKMDEGKSNYVSSSLGSVNAEEDDSESDIDLDLTVDVSKIETQQANELNTCAHTYGMVTNDFFSFLNNDLEEAENLRIAKEQEEEKAMFSGRKSRKERRAFRERTLVGRKLSPPSYAWRKSPSYEGIKALVSLNRSRSKSVSPVNSGKITYITSFGGDDPASSSRPNSKSRSISREKDWVKRVRRSSSSDADSRRKLSSYRRSRSPISNFGLGIKRKRTESFSESKLGQSPSRMSPKCNPEVTPVPSSSTSEPVVLTRYYGRNREKSSSELSLSSDDNASKHNQIPKTKLNQSSSYARISTTNKNTSSDKLTHQERLKRKRQVLLNKQYKADKRAEREKVLKQVQERMDRAEEMKEMSIKMRRRQRMMRHGDSPRKHSSRSDRSSSSEESVSRSPYSSRQYRRHDKHRNHSTSSSCSDSSRHSIRRNSKKHRSSTSRSRSRSYNRSTSRNRSRSPRRRRSEDRSFKRNSGKDCDKDDYKNDYRSRRSPRTANEEEGRRDRTRDNERYGWNRRHSGRRSSSRDRYSSKYNY